MDTRLFRLVRLKLVLPDPSFHRGLVGTLDDDITVLRTAVLPRLENGARRLRRLLPECLKHPFGCRLVCLLRGTLHNVHQHTFASDPVMGHESLDCARCKCFQKLVLLAEFHSAPAVPFVVGGAVGRNALEAGLYPATATDSRADSLSGRGLPLTCSPRPDENFMAATSLTETIREFQCFCSV